MNFELKDNNLIIFLEGNIDSNNADVVGQELESIKKGCPEDSLVLDAENLNYISSAGLRQILRLKKQEKDLRIINVSSEIYDIFEMTGFTEMIDIQKAYRKMSVEGCEIIGAGSNGIVYRINPDTIIKVYRDANALEDIKRERELARAALVMGVNTAIPYDVVKVGNSYGSVFELLSAKSLTKHILDNPSDRDKYIKIFVDMLKEIHATEVTKKELPSAKEKALEWARWLEGKIPEDTGSKLIRLIEEIPEDNHMIHGDYHTNNVHFSNDEAILIDMDTLSVGNPVFEFGSHYLAYQGFSELDHTAVERFLGIDYETATYIYNKTYELYFEGKDAAFIEAAKEKARVISYTRLLRRSMRRTPDDAVIIDHYRKQLIELTQKVDSLVF